VDCPGLFPEKAGVRGLSKNLVRKSQIFICLENHQVIQPVVVSLLRSINWRPWNFHKSRFNQFLVFNKTVFVKAGGNSDKNVTKSIEKLYYETEYVPPWCLNHFSWLNVKKIKRKSVESALNFNLHGVTCLQREWSNIPEMIRRPILGKWVLLGSWGCWEKYASNFDFDITLLFLLNVSMKECFFVLLLFSRWKVCECIDDFWTKSLFGNET